MEKHVRGGDLKHAGNRVREEPPEKNTQNKARKGVTSPPRVLYLGRGETTLKATHVLSKL